MNPAELVLRDLLARALPSISSTVLREAVADFLVTGHWDDCRSRGYNTAYYSTELDKAVTSALNVFAFAAYMQPHTPQVTRRLRLACRDLKRRLPRS